jgi:hypothetical protein
VHSAGCPLRKTIVYLTSAVLLFAVVLALPAVRHADRFSATLIAIPIVLAAAAAGVFLGFARQARAVLKTWGGARIEYEISDEGLTSRTANSSGQYQWSAFREWHESAEYVYLWMESNQCQLLFKKAFSSGNLDELRQLAGRKIARTSAAREHSWLMPMVLWPLLVLGFLLIWLSLSR